MARLSLVQGVAYALHQEMERDERVLVLGEDVGKQGGVFRATDGLFDKFGPERVIDTPLSESAIIGAAVGLAAYGFLPVAEIQFSDYVYPGFDQLVTQAAKLRYRSGSTFSAPLVLRMPSGGGVKGGHHHSQSPEAYFLHTPGLKVVMPSTPRDAVGLLLGAVRDPDPVIFMEPKRLYRLIKEEVGPDLAPLPLGQAAVRREGKDLTIVTYGACTVEADQAADELARVGIEAELIDLRTLNPWDRETVLNSVAKTGRALIVAEAPSQASFASEIAAVIVEEVMDMLVAPPLRVTGFDTPYPYAQDLLYLPGVTRILNAAKRSLDY
jgi:2-oxoisovalerate dehydrogenase E1 component beta subunit